MSLKLSDQAAGHKYQEEKFACRRRDSVPRASRGRDGLMLISGLAVSKRIQGGRQPARPAAARLAGRQPPGGQLHRGAEAGAGQAQQSRQGLIRYCQWFAFRSAP
jgi:hypothetical protein